MKHRKFNQVYSLLAVVAVYCALFVLGGCGGSLGPGEESSSSSSSTSSGNSGPSISEETPNSSGGQVTFDIDLTPVTASLPHQASRQSSPSPEASPRFADLQAIVIHVLDPVTLQEVGNSPQIVSVPSGATSQTVIFSCIPLGNWVVDVFGLGSSSSSSTNGSMAAGQALPANTSQAMPVSRSLSPTGGSGSVVLIPCGGRTAPQQRLERASQSSGSPNVIGFSSLQITVNPGSNFYNVNLGVAPGNVPNPFNPFGTSPSPSPASTSGPPAQLFCSGKFSQADLVGSWYLSALHSNSSDGHYERGLLQIDSSGNVTFQSYFNSNGGSPTGGTVSLNSCGILSGDVGTNAYGAMSQDKSQITETQGDSTNPSLAILQRVPTHTFATSDVNGTWEDMDLKVGPNNFAWQTETITLNNGLATPQGNRVSSDGSSGSGDLPFHFTVSPAGIMTEQVINNAPVTDNFQGFVSQDGNQILITSGDSSNPKMGLLVKTGGSFVQSDLAGNYNHFGLFTGSSPFWFHEQDVIDTSGKIAQESLFVSTNGSGTANFQDTILTITSGGLITNDTFSNFSGVMNLAKDKIVNVDGFGSTPELDFFQK